MSAQSSRRRSRNGEPSRPRRIQPGQRPLRILHVAMEIAPWAKVGGLADVLDGLPAAQSRGGDRVSVVVPAHGCAAWPQERIRDIKGAAGVLRLGDATVHFDLARMEHPRGFEVVLVRSEALYNRGGIYTNPHSSQRYPDALVRRSTLCHAALYYALLAHHSWDVVHAHDAGAALTTALLHFRFQATPLQHARSIFSLHNLGYLEQHPLSSLPYAGLTVEEAWPMGPLEFWGSFSALKAAMMLADRVHTVSPTYAREIVEDADIAGALHGVAATRKDVIVGVLNGLDLEAWTPGSDATLAAPFSPDKLAGREDCRRALWQWAGLDMSPVAGEPEPLVVGVVARLVHQKGLDLLAEAIPRLIPEGLRFMVVGMGEPDLEDAFAALAARFPGRVATSQDQADAVARRVYAGSDLFCVPSRYEPCGLTQQYALRYGSLPVVRRTGGLADTIDPEVGFLFEEPTSWALEGAIRAAAAVWRDPERRVTMQQAGMRRGRSWDEAATELRQRVYLPARH